DLSWRLQGAYTQLFRWLVLINGQEAQQIVAARLAMLLLLALSVVLLWRLAMVWTSSRTALLAPLSYLSMLPVVKHGASFRADSLLLPLSLMTLLLLARTHPSKRQILGA